MVPGFVVYGPPFMEYSPLLTLIGAGSVMPETVMLSDTTKTPGDWPQIGVKEKGAGVRPSVGATSLPANPTMAMLSKITRPNRYLIMFLS